MAGGLANLLGIAEPGAVQMEKGIKVLLDAPESAGGQCRIHLAGQGFAIHRHAGACSGYQRVRRTVGSAHHQVESGIAVRLAQLGQQGLKPAVEVQHQLFHQRIAGAGLVSQQFGGAFDHAQHVLRALQSQPLICNQFPHEVEERVLREGRGLVELQKLLRVPGIVSQRAQRRRIGADARHHPAGIVQFLERLPLVVRLEPKGSISVRLELAAIVHPVEIGLLSAGKQTGMHGIQSNGRNVAVGLGGLGHHGTCQEHLVAGMNPGFGSPVVPGIGYDSVLRGPCAGCEGGQGGAGEPARQVTAVGEPGTFV